MVREDRINCRRRGALKNSNIKAQKETGIESTCLFFYRHVPNTKTNDTDSTRNAGDNDAYEMCITENTNNTNMRTDNIENAIDKYEVSCPRCRYIMHHGQKSVQQTPIAERIFSKNICRHCQAQIKFSCPLTKEQFFYSKIKSDGVLLRQRKEKQLLNDIEITKFKDRSLFDIRRKKQKSILTKIDPWIRPLISSSNDESLSDVELPVKKVSLKRTVKVIQEPRHGRMFVDESSDDDMFQDKGSCIYLKIKNARDKRLFETETKTLKKPTKSTRPVKKISNFKSRHVTESLEKHLSINSLLTRHSEVPKSFLEKDFQFNFPRHVKKNVGEDKIGEGSDRSTVLLAQLQKQAEEKKNEQIMKKKLKEIKKEKLEEKKKKRQVSDDRRKQTEALNEQQRKEGISDRSTTSITGKSNKKRLSRTSEIEPSKTDDSFYKGKKKRLKNDELYESKDFSKGRKGQKHEEGVYKKKQEQQDSEKKKEGIDQQFKEGYTRGKTGPEKAKRLSAPGKSKEISEKEKASIAKRLSASEKDKETSDTKKALSGKRSLVLGKNKEISDNKSTSPASEKGFQVQEKANEGKSNKKEASPTTDEQSDKEWYLKPGIDNEKSVKKKKALPAIGKRLPAAGKVKEISNEDKTLSPREKGLQEQKEIKKDNKDKIDKKKILPLGKKDEKSDEAEIWYLAPGQKRKEMPDALKKEKLVTLQIKKDVTPAKDAVLNGKEDAIPKSKSGEKKKEKTKQKQKDEYLRDINKIKRMSTASNNFNNIISKKGKGPGVSTSIIIPPLPAIELTRKKKVIQSGDLLNTGLDRDLIETEVPSLSVDEVVYENKIVKKNKIPRVRGLSGTKERGADFVHNNIFNDDILQRTVEIPQTTKEAQSQGKVILTKDAATDGILRYALSDRTFIDKGWTLLPIEKVVCKTNVYRMRPAHPEFDWFEHNKAKGVMYYDSGEKLAEFKDKCLGQWFYRNGRLALNYYDAEDTNAQQRIVIYSNGEVDERGRSRPITILGMFDYVGNGVIFDHSGRIRLKYNQTEGVLLDREIGPASHWKWHSLNDPPVLQQVMIDTQMLLKDPRIMQLGVGVDNPRPEINKDMLAIEFENTIKEKSQKMNEKFKPFQIKMKALKINKNFSLRILDQASIYLLFRDGTTNLKLNLGMLLDSKEIIDTETEDLGEISTGIERLPAKTESLETMQRSIKYANFFERNVTEHERRLHPPGPAASFDRMKNLLSKPLKPPLTAVNCVTAINDESARCYSRKPSMCTLYYNNRLNQ